MDQLTITLTGCPSRKCFSCFMKCNLDECGRRPYLEGAPSAKISIGCNIVDQCFWYISILDYDFITFYLPQKSDHKEIEVILLGNKINDT